MPFPCKFLRSLILLSAAAPAFAHANTIGLSTSSFSANASDSCSDCSYILPTAFGTTGTISSYTFNGDGSGDITPLLLSGVNNGNGTTTFTITGIGTDRIGGSGNQTYSFGLTSGSSAVAANTYFGWFDNNGGLVTFTYNASGSGSYLYDGGNPLGRLITLENTTQYDNQQNSLNDRIYNMNAVVAVTPEPSSLILLGTGMAVAGILIRRRLRA